MATWTKEQREEWAMCLRKIRYSVEPSCTLAQRTYPCPHCQGWHKTTRRDTEQVKR